MDPFFDPSDIRVHIFLAAEREMREIFPLQSRTDIDEKPALKASLWVRLMQSTHRAWAAMSRALLKRKQPTLEMPSAHSECG